MGKYFGTDGFRGEAGVTLTARHAYLVGRFLGHYHTKDGRRARIVVGKDTRRSSYMLEYALVAGLTSSGADAYMLHVTTTPSVSFVTASEDFDGGVMISASHNPYTDNGIKLVNARGEKESDALQDEIERYLDDCYPLPHSARDLPYAKGEAIGRIVDFAAGRNRYIGYLISLSLHSFKGYRVGLDAANGSAWMIAKSVFDALGAKTYLLGDAPDGLNINRDCGSTHPEQLARFVRENRLDVGFAFDGDADRCIAVDERGEIVNGDHMLYLLAAEMKRRGELTGDAVVATVMSNLGLRRALAAAGIGYEETKVGDRYVYERMQSGGFSLGGEQSGHIILGKYATTGDGILTAVKVMETMISAKAPLSVLAAPMKMLPQALANLRVRDKDEALSHPCIKEEVAKIENELAGRGRILLRKSGTEPVLRIMVEAPCEEDCRRRVGRVAALMKELGLTEEEKE